MKCLISAICFLMIGSSVPAFGESIVPLTMDIGVHVYAEASIMAVDEDHNYGLNSASVYAEVYEEWCEEYATAGATISCTGGDWGGSIESCLYNMGYAEALTETYGYWGSTQTITIGYSESFPEGTSLSLLLDASEVFVYGGCNYFNDRQWELTIKRGVDTLLSIDGPGEQEILVFAGETLSVEFSHYMVSQGSGDLFTTSGDSFTVTIDL